MSLSGALLDLLLEAYHKVEIAKNMALASVAFFVYDLLITIGPEIRHVWSSKWGYGRLAFHFNRIWSIIVLAVYVPMIFSYNVPIPRLAFFVFDIRSFTYLPTNARCRRVITFYGYGVILLIFNTSIVMALRAWILYDRNPFVFAGLTICCVGGAIGCMVIFQMDIGRMTIIPNPVPDLITGCLTILPRRVTLVPYLIGLSLDTAIFLATLYRTWELNRTGVRLPIIHCLMRDGLFYYVINCASLLISICLGLDENINNIALGSAYIIALHSTLCNRILLSLRVFNNESKGSVLVNGSGTRTGSTTLHDTEWRAAGDGSYQGIGQRTGVDDHDCERQDMAVELGEIKRP
ncbi:unnamed protein product [Rhizoctonia solani]|uniref:DUF6533 domain-containing protein n=1 Tax=Rhizoctonia solani TaxID=456999 RepID=A0A8H2X310_9AGAM|nr:unnamed protein product [Rhizoctonia solani]